ncbi:MAG: thioredoxin family protein [Propionicimonas sp.]
MTTPSYEPETISPEQAAELPGATVLQFGTNWCGYCRAAEQAVEPALAPADRVRRILVEDGKGRPLGRSFGVKLWPTLVFLADGVEVARVVRPRSSADLAEPLARLDEALANA